MDFEKSKKLIKTGAVIYWVLVLMIYAIAYPQFKTAGIETDAPSANNNIGELTDGVVVEQNISLDADWLTAIEFIPATYQRTNSGTLGISVTNAQGEQIAYKEVDISTLPDSEYVTVPLDQRVKITSNEPLTVTFTTHGSTSGSAITIYTGNSVSTGRYNAPISISEDESFKINGTAGNGKLCLKAAGIRELSFYKTYWYIVIPLFAVLALLTAYWWKKAKQGKNNPLVAICTMLTKYKFLIHQLVSRDFKTKYKRSVLGVAWSFLNPLLTMLVQYVVFSTLFKSDIPNYPVYLLSGTVFMNFFSEATSMGMTSITSNSSLIKKVYIPKYIYPLARILSSLINFGFAMMPLFLVMLITKTPFRLSLFLLIFDVICLLGFITGMVLLLTTMMTFFQDTQFLWSVVSMMWMYLTPVFYPDTIIPAQYQTLYHMNPMYQYISFARVCIMDGVSPTPMAYFYCILSSAVVLLFGILVFKKNQDKFILYL